MTSYTFRDIYFINSYSFSNKTLIKVSGIPIGKETKSLALLSGLQKVIAFYRSMGYLDFKIIDYKVTKRGSFHYLYVYVYEGTRKIIKEFFIEPDTFNFLLKFLRKKFPTYYSEDFLLDFEEKIYSYFTENGFYFFNYDRLVERNFDTLKIVYKLKPGKKVRVSEIKIDGLSPKTRKKIVLDAIELKEGDYLLLDKLYLSIKNLYSMGIIRSLDYRVVPNFDSTEVEIHFNLKEEKIRALRSGYGYSSDGFSQLKLELEHLNIFNNAQKLALLTRSHFNSKIFLRWELSLRYQDPNFVIKKNILELLPFYYFDKFEDVIRFGFESRYMIKRGAWIFETNLIWQNVRYILKLRELFYLNGIGFSYTQDKRDNILDTKEGYRIYQY
ncbi:MAG: POTRA domain-containing protein, partial [Candidatus Hydrothermales bacterium]